MQSKEPHDIRLVYLAIHHILKHRGHFLYQGSFEDVAEMKVDMMLSELIAAAEEILSISLSAIDGEEIANVLQNPDYGITKKKQELLKLFNYQKEDKKAVTTLMNLLAGGTVNLSDLFSDESLDSCGQKKITFKGSSYDDNETLFRETLLDRFGVIEASKKLYDWAILQNILNGKTSISEAKVEVYEQHQTDLTLLKGMVRAYCPEKYKEVFGIPKEKTANYSAYVGSGMLKGKKIIVEKGCTQEKFYDYLCKTVFKGITAEDEAFDNMMEQIERGNFLPKQKSKDNGFIPYQIHLKELEMILENASAYLPFLTEKEEDGHTVREKIVSIMTFRIPYYVGPLNGAHRDSGFYWAIKKSQEPIRPWNFDEVIDREASAEKFIRRMTNKCTYLIKEDVIPKDSLYYSAFTVLNELNNLRINGDKISVDLKQKIFQDLFLQEKKVKQNRLKRYLIEEGYHGKNEEISITGIDGDFKASMTSYIDFKGILGKEIFTDKEKAMVEDLIKYIVLFGDEKKMLDQKIRTTYGDVLTEKQISEIKKRKYSQWGRFSKKLLTEICVVDVATGEYISILSAPLYSCISCP